MNNVTDIDFDVLVASNQGGLRRCREFYTAYPQIRGALSPKFDHLISAAIRKSLIVESTQVATAAIRETVTPK